jgi:hypothetical protein
MAAAAAAAAGEISNSCPAHLTDQIEVASTKFVLLLRYLGIIQEVHPGIQVSHDSSWRRLCLLSTLTYNQKFGQSCESKRLIPTTTTVLPSCDCDAWHK